MARGASERDILRPCAHKVRHASLSTSIAELPGRLSPERHLLLPRRAKSGAAGPSGVACRESTEQSQNTHQRPDRQVRRQPKDIKVFHVSIISLESEVQSIQCSK